MLLNSVASSWFSSLRLLVYLSTSGCQVMRKR